MREIRIEFPKFPTHIQINEPKRITTRPKFEKIGYNKIYSGGIHYNVRSIMIRDMHDYLLL